MNNLQKMGGVAALLEAILYVSAFIFFGVFLAFPSQAGMMETLAFLKENQTSLMMVNFFIYIVFGTFLVVLVLALHDRIKNENVVLMQVSSIFGSLWAGMVIACGMIKNIGLGAVIELSLKQPEQALSLWLTVTTITEGLGGGNEIVGGLWVLLLSIAARKNKSLPNKLIYLGLFVGLAGVCTVYPIEILTAVFGLSQILWFAWLALILLTEPEREVSAGCNTILEN